MMECSDAAEALSQSFPHLGAERVNELVAAPVDPEESIAREVEESEETEQAHRALDTWLRTFTANSHYRNKKVLRSQVGVRIPFATDELLNTVAQMPHERYRRDAFPFTKGTIPRSMAPLKRDLVTRLDDPLAEIPYERTRVGTSRPLWLHDATYVGKQLYWKFVTGRPDANLGDWSREDPATRRALTAWLDRAADRDVFDREGVETLAEEHFSGTENHLTTIAPITGVELWLEKHLDEHGDDPTDSQATASTPDRLD
jgi:asparagine synthase (glutamine-hydrolysing)